MHYQSVVHEIQDKYINLNILINIYHSVAMIQQHTNFLTSLVIAVQVLSNDHQENLYKLKLALYHLHISQAN